MEKKQSTLTQKWNILRSISQVSSNWADLTLYALPKTNPSLQYLSQLRLLAAENGLILSDVKVSSGGETAGNLSAINGSFSVLGAKESITSFCQSLGRMAPLTVISKIDLSDGGGASKADIGTRTFYASLPKTIPSISQSITDLTASEKELITEIESLSTPAIGQTFTPSTEGITSAPFGE